MMGSRWELEALTVDLTRMGSGATEKLPAAAQAMRERLKKHDVGFYDWPLAASADELARLEATATRLRRDFEGALCFGIGGSFLGPAAIQAALRSPDDDAAFPVRWVSNVDPGAIAEAVYLAKKRRLAAVVISKSGGTTETLSGFFHLSRYLDKKGIVAITDPNVGELRRLATQEGWDNFPVPSNIGGRFSVLTAVGLLPTLLCGLSARELLDGARRLRASLEKMKPEENPAYRFAAAAVHWDMAGLPMHVHMPYREQLAKIGGWFAQLWGESIGKKRTSDGKRVGFTPIAALGTADQHSLLQLFKEGPRDKVVGFVDVKTEPVEAVGLEKVGEPVFASKGLEYLYRHDFGTIVSAASHAVAQSLTNAEVPTYRLELHGLDEKVLGAYFFFMQTACALAGELYGVDAFDQPGVEETKKLWKAALL